MPQGTSIGGVDVSGLRPGEACAAVSESLRQELEGYALTVRAGGRAYVFRPPEIGWKADIAGAAARALREGGAQPLEKERALVREDAVLARICADAYRTGSPARALFDADAEEPFTFVRERAGRYIDGAALQSAVRAALAQGRREVRVRAVRVAPGCTLAEARASAALLSSFTTYYAESNAGRAHNVALAASRLNGRTIAPAKCSPSTPARARAPSGTATAPPPSSSKGSTSRAWAAASARSAPPCTTPRCSRG